MNGVVGVAKVDTLFYAILWVLVSVNLNKSCNKFTSQQEACKVYINATYKECDKMKKNGNKNRKRRRCSMKFSEFKKLSYEKMNWPTVINEFNPCPKCGGKVDIKDDWEHGYWGDAQHGYDDHYRNWWHKPYSYKHFYFECLSDWDKQGLQYYICKECNNKIQTEKSKARGLEIDAGTEVFRIKSENEGDIKVDLTEEEKKDYEKSLHWMRANTSLMSYQNAKRYTEFFQQRWWIDMKRFICLNEINEIEVRDPLFSRSQKIFSDIKHGETYSRKSIKRPMLITNILPSYPDRDEVLELEKKGYVKILRHGTRVRTNIDSVDDIILDLSEREIERWRFLKRTEKILVKKDNMFSSLIEIIAKMCPHCCLNDTPFFKTQYLEEARESFEDRYGVGLDIFVNVDELDAKIIELKKESDKFHEIWDAIKVAVKEDNSREEARERAEYLKLHPRQITLFGETANTL